MNYCSEIKEEIRMKYQNNFVKISEQIGAGTKEYGKLLIYIVGCEQLICFWWFWARVTYNEKNADIKLKRNFDFGKLDF